MPLTSVEQGICLEVVRRFLDQHEATPRNLLLRRFKGDLAQPLQKLVDHAVLKVADHANQTYLPWAIAFHYCGDSGALAIARESTELVLRVLQQLFDAELESDNKELRQCMPGDVEAKARVIEPRANSQMIWLGLYLAEEFGVFQVMQWDHQRGTVISFRPSERIYEVMKRGNAWQEHVQRYSASVEPPSLKQGESLLPSDEILGIGGLASVSLSESSESRKIFLVHGHALEVESAVSAFLKSLDLDVVILHEQPNQGQTIVEKFEKHSDVGFAVVLLTPDDVGASVREPEKTRRRARQNVILELGYFIGKLGRKRVCPIYVEDVELPSDIHGVLYVLYDHGGAWRAKLAQEIQAAGIEVDLKKAIPSI